MSPKLKALGFALLAALSVSAVAAMNVVASEGGHFVTTGNTHTHILGTEGPEHHVHLVNHGLEGEIGCDESLLTATTTAETSPSITATATYNKCYTTSNKDPVTVKMNECTYKLDVKTASTDATEQTAHLFCPAGKSIVIEHPNCTITIPAQTVTTGITYTTVVESGIHAITAHVNIEFNTQFHGGICVFLGTNHKGTLKGTVTVKAFNTEGIQVPLTFT